MTPAMARTSMACWSGRTGRSRRCHASHCLDLLLLLPLMSRCEELPCDQPFACEPVILVPGVMGSRLRSYSRVPGTIDTVSGHIWLPESHRLLLRTVGASVGQSSQREAWINSLMPGEKQAAGKRIEPDRTNWGLKGVACILKTGRECVGTAKVFWDMVLHLEKVRRVLGCTVVRGALDGAVHMEHTWSTRGVHMHMEMGMGHARCVAAALGQGQG